MVRRSDYTGKKFGRLLLLKYTHSDKYSHQMYKCLCDCGNIKIIPIGYMKSGNTKSCGCLKKEFRKKSKEHVEKMRQRVIGKLNPMYGKTHSKKVKLQMSLNNSGKKNPNYGNGDKIKGDKNPNWRGGRRQSKYSRIWTRIFRQSIRERDNHTCQICKLNNNHLDVHHIDYNKLNCDIKNLISLCKKCHSKTNGNREYWINFFLGSYEKA